MDYLRVRAFKMKQTITINRSILAGAVGLLLSLGTVQASSDMHQLYEDNCASCHASDHGGYLAPALNKDTLKGRSPTALRTLIMTGSFETLMPPFFGKLKDADIRDMVKYLQSTPKLDNPAWTLKDMQASLKIYVKDESKLPSKPIYQIDSMDDLIGVAARGKYGRGKGSKAIFINSKTHQIVGEIETGTAAHIIDFDPANSRWAYVKTDTAEIFKVDLYSMQAVRSIKTGYNGPALGVSRDGNYIMAGSFVPHNAVILNSDLEPLKLLELEGIDPDGNMVSSDSGMIIGTPYADVFAIALENAGQVWVVDLKKGFPITKIKNVGRHLHDAFLTHKGQKLMVASYDDSIVTAIDLKTRTIIKKLKAGCVPHVGGGAAVKVNGRTLGFGTNFGTCDNNTVVSVWDLDKMELVKQIPVSGGTESPAAHANAPYVAVDIITKDRRARTIQLIDKKSLEVVKTLDVGGHAYFPEYSADGQFLYVSAGYAGDEVVVYDSKSLEKVATIGMESPAGIFSRGRVKYMTRGLSPDEME